jgi:hypothetical protein
VLSDALSPGPSSEGRVRHEAIAELIAARDPAGSTGPTVFWALSFELWARIYLDGRDPADVTDELKAVAA